MISAYTLSALSLEGARSSERQMMASGWLLSIASLAFSYSAPVDKMHRLRPIRSLFHPAIFISILCQAAIHLGTMVYAVRLATETMGPQLLEEVKQFQKAALAGEADIEESEDSWAEMMMLWSRPFKPNLLNTNVFLVETAQIIAVLFVNYKGRPWMKGVMENHALFLSLFATVGGVAFCSWGVSPELNSLIHLEPFPNDEYRWQIMALVGISILGSFICDRVVTAIFAREIFAAMLVETANTRLSDLVPIVMTLFKVAGGFILLGTGNPILWAGAYWLYRKYNNPAPPK